MIFLIEDQCSLTRFEGVDRIKIEDLKELESLYKEIGSVSPDFNSIELHFNYDDKNNYDGIIIIKKINLEDII